MLSSFSDDWLSDLSRSRGSGTINTLRHLSQEDFGIIYLTEDMAQEIPDTIAHYDRQVTPAVILIPTHKGSTGLGRQRIRDNVEKAVGQDIL